MAPIEALWPLVEGLLLNFFHLSPMRLVQDGGEYLLDAEDRYLPASLLLGASLMAPRKGL